MTTERGYLYSSNPRVIKATTVKAVKK